LGLIGNLVEDLSSKLNTFALKKINNIQKFENSCEFAERTVDKPTEMGNSGIIQ
jgi:hypothetical protein